MSGGVRVNLGSDHAAFELKQAVIDWLGSSGYEPVDHGPLAYDADDDYPPYVLAAASAVAAEPGSFGIVLGGSGNGEAIAANKVVGIRAADSYGAQVTNHSLREIFGRMGAGQTNIGPKQRRLRAAYGYVLFGLAAITLISLYLAGAERPWRLLLWLPFTVGAITFLQAYEKT